MTRTRSSQTHGGAEVSSCNILQGQQVSIVRAVFLHTSWRCTSTGISLFPPAFVFTVMAKRSDFDCVLVFNTQQLGIRLLHDMSGS